MTLKVIMERGADGYIIAECPQLPGCMSQGKTKEEALANIKDAIQAVIKVMINDVLQANASSDWELSDQAEEQELELTAVEMTVVRVFQNCRLFPAGAPFKFSNALDGNIAEKKAAILC